jgi:hypothetical protein
MSRGWLVFFEHDPVRKPEGHPGSSPGHAVSGSCWNGEGPAVLPPSPLNQPACKPGFVWQCPKTLRDDHSSGTLLAQRLEQPTRTTDRRHPIRTCHLRGSIRVVPIRSCSRWGLPCRLRCRRRGALLPHRFTLAVTLAGSGGFISVALSLRSCRACARFLSPDVIRHRMSMEPGLSSRGCLSTLPQAAVRPTDKARCGGRRREGQERGTRSVNAGLRRVSRRASVSRVEMSARPSTRSGRKWRWNAETTILVASS